MSGHCKDCIYWSTKVRDDVYPDDFDGNQPKLKWRHRACLKVIDPYNRDKPLSDEELINLPEDSAFVDVYDVYLNELMTGPDFGCVHFEQTDGVQNEP